MEWETDLLYPGKSSLSRIFFGNRGVLIEKGAYAGWNFRGLLHDDWYAPGSGCLLYLEGIKWLKTNEQEHPKMLLQ